MRARLELLVVASLLAVIDIAHKRATPAQYHHVRSVGATFVMSLVVVGLVVLVPRVPSRAARIGAAIAVGGALGNLVSVFLWQHGVPDPLVLTGPEDGIAFNLADIFALAGDLVLLTAVMICALRRRALLHERV